MCSGWLVEFLCRFFGYSVPSRKCFGVNDWHKTSIMLPVEMTRNNRVPHLTSQNQLSQDGGKKKKEILLFEPILNVFVHYLHPLDNRILSSAFQWHINYSTLWWFRLSLLGRGGTIQKVFRTLSWCQLWTSEWTVWN